MKIEELGPFEVAYIHHVGPYMNVGPVFDELSDWCAKHGLLDSTAQLIGISMDDPKTTEPEKLRFDVCMVVPPDTMGDGRVGRMQIPKGAYATHMHIGHYRGLTDAFQSLRNELTDAGHTKRNVGCIEIYVDDPSITPHDEVQTLIGIPIEHEFGAEVIEASA